MATAAAMTAGSITGSVCAIVVAYFPDEKFNERLQAVLPQVARVVVVDNTPPGSAAPKLADSLKDPAKVHLISNRANLGISAALNQGLHHALEAGFKWALTLDQDTL